MCMQMLDHSDQMVSLIIDGGEEETKSWVWMWSGRSKAFTQSLYFLTQRVPMVQVEDLPEAMQCQVVVVPRAWVRLFR